jgi:hypothetical protein
VPQSAHPGFLGGNIRKKWIFCLGPRRLCGGQLLLGHSVTVNKAAGDDNFVSGLVL